MRPRLGWAALAASLAACGGPTVHMPDCSASKQGFAVLQKTTFKPLCTFSSCHDVSSMKGDMDLLTDPYAALVGATPMNPAAIAKGWQRVVPGDEARSFLLTKLTLS